MAKRSSDERQQLLRLVVKRVTVNNDILHIETVTPVDDELRIARGEPVGP